MRYCSGGVMISVIETSTVDGGFEPVVSNQRIIKLVFAVSISAKYAVGLLGDERKFSESG